MQNNALRAVAVTKSDTTELGNVQALYVGVSGDVAVMPFGSDVAVTFKAHPVGYMPVAVRRVMSTNTTATDIVALY